MSTAPSQTEYTLASYNRKRDFTQTAEPKGRVTSGGGHRFVVQKHAARRLHYDFRLELDGILLSWAVARGPSLDPADKRLAVRTEDHPAAYADFEGTIPQGNYGAGTVMLWDRGTWSPDGDPHEAIKNGRLRFTLHGERMRGAWLLIRMKGSKRENWLLRKLEDDEANRDSDLTQSHTSSITTGRSLEQIAAGERTSTRRSSNLAASRPMPLEHRAEPPIPVSLRDDKSADEARAGHAQPVVQATKRARARTAERAMISHGVRITSPDRQPYPQAKVSKRDLVAYYEQVSVVMLPHISGRPLTLIRCPRGVDARCFVQQHAAPGFPEAVRTVSVTEASGETQNHIYVEDLAGILACVQIGALEFHGWGARAGALEVPDRLVLDLDPDPAVAFGAVVDAALFIRDRLLEDGLSSWPMLSGGKGVHVIVPLTGATWPAVSAYAKQLAQAMEKQAPERFTAEMAKTDRSGRIFIDYLRNQRGATAVMPYSTRAKASASIAMPLDWDRLGQTTSAQAYTVHDVLEKGLPEVAEQASAPQRLPRSSPGGE